MGLVTIADLLGPKEKVDALIRKAMSISDLYDTFTELDEGDGHLRKPGIHASEISKCERKMAYSIMATPGKRAIKKIWRQRFSVGHALHKMIQDDFCAIAARSGGLIDFEPEVKISPELQPLAKKLNLHSSCDGVFSFCDDPRGPLTLRVGLEIKTEAPDSFKNLKEPRPDHIEQAHVYMAALDLPIFYFLYFNKGNQNNTPSLEPYLIKFDQERWNQIEERCKRVLAMVSNSQMPERKEGIHCDFCSYSYTCQPSYGNQNGMGSSRWKQLRGT